MGSTLFARADSDNDAAATTSTTTTTTTVPALAADAPATTTTTTIPRPPTLTGRVPTANQVFTVMRNGPESSVEGWGLGFREALVFGLGGGVDRAHFNVDSSLLALLSFGDAENGTLRIGVPTHIGTRAVDVTAAAWHDTEPNALAFVARLPLETDLSLLTATVADDSFDFVDVQRITTLPDGATVEAWGDWGFAINTTEPIVVSFDGAIAESEAILTVILDLQGDETARRDGWVVDSLPSGTLLIRTFWDIIETLEDGVAVIVEKHEVTRTDASLEPNGQYDLLTSGSRAFLNPNGSHMSEVVVNPSGVTLVTSRSFERPSNRSGSVPGFLGPLGFNEDGSLFILHDPTANELVFLDWTDSTQYRLPTGDGIAIAIWAR